MCKENEIFCPVTGLRVRQDEKWQGIRLGEQYKVSFEALGKYIIISRAEGFTSYEICKEYCKFLESVVEENIGKTDNYLLIEDYSKHSGASLLARNYYVQYQRNNARLKGVIFVTQSPFFKLMIELAKEFAPPGMDVLVCPLFEEALKIAWALAKEKHIF